MAKTLCILAGIMLFKILTLILLQGVLTSHALVKSDISSGDVTDSKDFASASSQQSETAKSRQKRCTCYSYKDKECVYYCHLDIIWINTPERTVPYGMSSYRGPQRSRRAADGQPSERESAKTPRCVCAVIDADPECDSFCLSSDLSSKGLNGPRTCQQKASPQRTRAHCRGQQPAAGSVNQESPQKPQPRMTV